MLIFLALMSAYSLSLVKESSAIVRLRLESAKKLITVDSALKLLDFSKEYKEAVTINLNGYFIRTYKDGSKWYVEIVKNGIREVYSE
ncbi:hypothetical protein AT15_03475 [Kosmotoga arenicorallina S304]|uniref:Uncharacterized protein n=1 Tax=Kosmotoga arenicorallina S304 TaxID=1453497 RepID=A0A176K452_9BACT|nr:hypothetical protein [Kosmotoga arenicorallina]OAA31897.1 hypothetical protein AT15_03475 [Kosmotoga arenicorallina S304]